MNIEKAILEEHSKVQAGIIACYVGKDPARFAQLMELVLGHQNTAARRAAWVMAHCCKDVPHLIEPYWQSLFRRMKAVNTPSAIKRNTLRILQDADLPDDLCGEIFNLCFDYLNDPDETIAVRVYSMTILTEICKQEPELADEVSLLINQYLPTGTGAYRSRARKMLKQLDLTKNNDVIV